MKLKGYAHYHCYCYHGFRSEESRESVFLLRFWLPQSVIWDIQEIKANLGIHHCVGHCVSAVFPAWFIALYIFQSPQVIAYVFCPELLVVISGRESRVCLLNLNQNQKFFHFFVTLRNFLPFFPLFVIRHYLMFLLTLMFFLLQCIFLM